MEEESNGCFENGVLLWDSGYTPYNNPQNEAQGQYNQAHSKTRRQMERTFGRLKRRVHVLHPEVGLKGHDIKKFALNFIK